MATVTGQTRQLHPLVTLDYRGRMVSMVVVALIPLFHFRGRPPLPVLAGMIFAGLLWPQIAYLAAKNARDTRAAEIRNLLFDSFIVGAWSAAMSFSLLPSAVMVAALNSANLSVGGLRQAARGLAAILLGMVVVGLPLGFRVQPESDLWTALFCVVGVLTVTTIFGYYGHLQTKRVRLAKNALYPCGRTRFGETEALGLHHLLDDRVAAVGDREEITLVEDWAGVIPFAREHGPAGEDDGHHFDHGRADRR